MARYSATRGTMSALAVRAPTVSCPFRRVARAAFFIRPVVSVMIRLCAPAHLMCRM